VRTPRHRVSPARVAAALLALLALLALTCFDGQALRHEPCADHLDCGPQLRCDAGYCGGPPPLFECGAVVEVDVDNFAPSLMLIVDRSGSMADPARWTLVQQLVAGLIDRFGDAINLGLVLFPSASASGLQTQRDCQNQLRPEHALGPDRAQAILAALASTEPRGASPTTGAVQLALQHFTATEQQVVLARADLISTPGGDALDAALLAQVHEALPRALLLITDGAPNCGADLLDADDPFSKFETFDPALLAVAEQARARQIPLFIVGVALEDALSPVLADGQPDSVNPYQVMRQLAEAGGGAYYVAAQAAELFDALAALPAPILTCTIPLDPAPDYPERIEVLVDGAPVELAQAAACAASGYRFTSAAMDTIELCGAACTRYQATGALRLSHRCPAQ
jgi:hypothetical protein